MIRTKLLAECATPSEAIAELGTGLTGFDPSLIDYTEVEPEEMPQPARQLLVHQKHMVKTLAAYYGRPVDLHVIEKHYDGQDLYHRKIYLTIQESPRIVEYGIVRLDFRFMSASVKQAILEAHAPLGSILINHNVLRMIRPRWYLRFPQNCPLLHWFGSPMAGPMYGRSGTIYCNGEPAIELLEIVTAIPA